MPNVCFLLAMCGQVVPEQGGGEGADDGPEETADRLEWVEHASEPAHRRIAVLALGDGLDDHIGSRGELEQLRRGKGDLADGVLAAVENVDALFELESLGAVLLDLLGELVNLAAERADGDRCLGHQVPMSSIRMKQVVKEALSVRVPVPVTRAPRSL